MEKECNDGWNDSDELLLHRNMDCLNDMYGKCIFKMKKKTFVIS